MMLRGMGYVVANRGEKAAGSETAACPELFAWAGRMSCRLAMRLPLSLRGILGVA